MRPGRFHLASSGRGQADPLFNESLIADHLDAALKDAAEASGEVVTASELACLCREFVAPSLNSATALDEALGLAAAAVWEAPVEKVSRNIPPGRSRRNSTESPVARRLRQNT